MTPRHHRAPMPAGYGERNRGDGGFVGGSETLIFGVLIFVVGSLLMFNAWAVVDASMATSSAARETARFYVESDGSADGAITAGRRAFETTTGFDSADVDISIAGTFERCQRINVTADFQVPAVSLPFGIGWGAGFTVSASHSEIVDPFRSGLEGRANC